MRLLACLICLVATYGVSAAEDVEAPQRSPFDAGRFTLSVSAGTQSSLGERYFVIGATGGIFVADGLQVGAGVLQWIGSGPSVTQLSPRVRYVFSFWDSPVVPYVSTQYDHWFISDGISDVDAVSAGGGIVALIGRRLILSVGARHEWIVSSCDEDCTAVLPELSLALSF